jgi:lipopolysaccharide export system permease protein
VAAETKLRTTSRAEPRRYALHRYVGRRFAETAAMSFAVIFVAYLLIDFVGRIDWFAQHSATPVEILRYYSARIWMLFADAAPMALLVGTGLTVSLLVADGELLGMRACGIQAPKALLSVMILSLLAVPAYFLLINVVTPRMSELQQEVKVRDIYGRGADYVSKRPVWYPTGNKLVESRSLSADRGAAREGLTIYDLGKDGLPIARTDASSGMHLGRGRWQLEQPERIELGPSGLPRRAPASPYVQFDSSFVADLDTSYLTLAELNRAIDDARRENLDSTELEVEHQTRLAQPLACFLLPLVVLLYAVGGNPLPRPSGTLSVSVVIGVGYVLVTGFATTLGYGHTLSPIVAGWGPNILCGFLAVGLGWRVRQRS